MTSDVRPAPGGRHRRVHGLAARVAAATRWSLLNTVVIRLGNFAIGVILARYLLGPREWGLYAVGLLVLSVLLSANEMGVSLAVVRWDGDVRRFAPTVLTLSFASSAALYGMLFLAAPSVARLLGSTDATWMLRVLCFSVVIDGIACVPHGVITREFLQGRRMAIDFSVFAVSGAVTIALAAAGVGAMSFAWGSIAGSVSSLIGSALAAPGYIRFGWDRAQARALLRFGLPLAGASLLVLAMINVDSAVVGAMLGPATLGLYQIAFNVSSWPVRSLSEAARRVSFAGFSRIAGTSAALADGFSRALTLLMSAAVPICVLLAVLAEPVIRTVYGPQWTGAAVALRYLAILGLARVAFELAYDCLGASRHRKSLIVVQGLWLVALVPTLILFARGGIAGVGQGHVVVALAVAAPAFLVALRRAGIPVGAVVRACALPLLGGVGAAFAAWGVQRLVADDFVGLMLAGFAGLAAYAPVVPALLRRVRARPAPAAAEDDADEDAAQPQAEPPVPVGSTGARTA
jgi:O-antigen/teichoic acid export membrane protein